MGEEKEERKAWRGWSGKRMDEKRKGEMDEERLTFASSDIQVHMLSLFK